MHANSNAFLHPFAQETDKAILLRGAEAWAARGRWSWQGRFNVYDPRMHAYHAGHEKTVAAMDVLVPRIGEIIGGSQREERHDVLLEKIRAMAAHGMKEESYWWYLDLRRYGGVKHAGFGMGFERMMMYLTGMRNIRDVIPFPRTPGNAEF